MLLETQRKYSHVAELFAHLAPLSEALSLAYAAIDPYGWRSSISPVNSLCHFHPGSEILRRTKWEAWTGRANSIISNLFTHLHRDVKDSLKGMAAIAVFGSFTSGELKVCCSRLGL